MTKKLATRREMLTISAAALGWGGIGASAARGANDRIRMGFIGVGNRGSQLLSSFMKNGDAEIAALCDVYEPYLQRDRSRVDKDWLDALGERIPKMGESFPTEPQRYLDFRRLLEQKDIDAVCIATPDHWHAIQTIMAVQAGKDVYVEKPLSIAIHEGRRMVMAAQRTKQVVQVGLHRRSSTMYAHLAQLVQGGGIGTVSVARAYRVSNMFPKGIGHCDPAKPPEGFDWDMWLGPREEREFQTNISPYKFRWWQDYSSQMGNWGVHYCDAIRWVLNEEAPVSISAHGSKIGFEDDRTIPATMEATFELPSGVLLVFGQYEASGGDPLSDGEIEFRGTKGNLYPAAEGAGYKIVPTGGGQFQSKKRNIQAVEQGRMDGDLTDQHVRNFLDCAKSRERCHCDLETGHRSTTFAHLANIALATRSRLDWDPVRERFTNNEEANKLLQYEYRKPWRLG
ncbi:MAG: Gfo/Idh/MocA family oxidoreductase [Candidatus Omnitrophota bacterium]